MVAVRVGHRKTTKQSDLKTVVCRDGLNDSFARAIKAFLCTMFEASLKSQSQQICRLQVVSFELKEAQYRRNLCF